MKNLSLYALVFLSLSCQGTKIEQLFSSASPYDKYLHDLKSSTLKNNSLVKDWEAAGEQALADSNSVELPYKELTQFDPAAPEAASFLFSAREGQEITINLKLLSDTSAIWFIDLFKVNGSGDLEQLKPERNENASRYPVGSEGKFLLRLQPELLKGGLVELSISYASTLSFPLLEKSYLNIASFFGDSREGGRRKHEGVDIFAARGTPVLAVSEGRVSRVGNNRLGGKTVRVSSGRYSYYYAHLDSQVVSAGSKVKPGDTLGTVGNTGNARTTAPHLHFGIYAPGWKSLDPLHFFQDAPELADLPMADSVFLNNWGRVKGELVNLRQGPSTRSLVLDKLGRQEVFRIEGKTAGWLRIRLPDHRKGFLASNLAEDIESPLDKRTLQDSDWLKVNWWSSEFQHPSFSGKAEVFGSFGQFDLVTAANGIQLWVKNQADRTDL
ncbi:M23 family metallopeptidase [Cyclobacterium jeungdonense]|uniref:M23 family metallopeptidase n=1 Tax=Cyclobacterium jeungdonense TaxID=708087 RepID=A0ABT8CE59_9BACT|nr:M23 family metallopeptidase [Cyclobacterium jeungdonense]MDN3690472.1 M23 family metallopeptidase [Cyclobacterium jeungdonense]